MTVCSAWPSLEEFVDALAAQVPDRYRHAMRYFGLLAPSTKRMTSAALFALLGQIKRPRPQRLSWRNSLRKYFGVDPSSIAAVNPCIGPVG
jgi:S-formylglutathione hydrolase FrmB